MRIDDSWYRRPAGMPEVISAGGVVVRLENRQILVALAVQKGRSEYILPKGRVEEGETIEAAALREIEEETGLSRLQLLGSLGVGERLDYRKRSWKKIHYFLVLTDQTDGLPTDDRHDEVKWFPIDAFPDLFWPEQTRLIRDNREMIEKLIKLQPPAAEGN